MLKMLKTKADRGMMETAYNNDTIKLTCRIFGKILKFPDFFHFF